MLEIYGFLFILILGSINHFIYDWTNHKKIASIFFAVNESVWEHMKLIVFPLLIWILIEIPLIGKNSNFITAKFISLIIMLAFIPLFYYLYRFIFKKDKLFLDILDFILAIFLGQYLSFKILTSESLPYIYNYLSLILIIILYICFLIFTIMPGKNFLFVDPVVKDTGLNAHTKLDLQKRR